MSKQEGHKPLCECDEPDVFVFIATEINESYEHEYYVHTFCDSCGFEGILCFADWFHHQIELVLKANGS